MQTESPSWRNLASAEVSFLNDNFCLEVIFGGFFNCVLVFQFLFLLVFFFSFFLPPLTLEQNRLFFKLVLTSQEHVFTCKSFHSCKRADFGKTALSMKEVPSLIYKNSTKIHLNFISPANSYKGNATVSGTAVVSVFLKPFKMWVSRMKSNFFFQLIQSKTTFKGIHLQLKIIRPIKNNGGVPLFYIISVFCDTLKKRNYEQFQTIEHQ